jgi:hypothetical protein
MSWKCCEYVADRCAVTVYEAAVLMVYANTANDHGENAYPSIGYVVHRSKMSESAVHRMIAQLKQKGWLEVVEAGGGRGIKTVYKIRFDRIPTQQAWREKRVPPTAPFSGPETVPLVGVKGATGVSPNKEEPVSEPVSKPARRPKAAEPVLPHLTYPLWQWMIETTTRIYEQVNGVPIPWNGRTSTELKRLFERTRRWKQTDYEKALGHYFNSDDINPADAPEFVFKNLTRYVVGPLNERHLPKGKSNGKTVAIGPGECSKHPGSGLTDRGGCNGCYYAEAS